MIQKIFLSCLLILSLASCKTSKSIPVLNLSQKEYPVRKVDLKKIAKIEYIMPETTDSSLIASAKPFISDKYIIGIEKGDLYTSKRILVFDRKTGKYLWGFNRKGTGPQEYRQLDLTAVDFEAEECYIHDLDKKAFLVYSFQGIFKRAIPDGDTAHKTPKGFFWATNYNKDSLMAYNALPHYVQQFTDQHPFYLVSKKDGKYTPVPLSFSNPISVASQQKGNTYPDVCPYFPFYINGNGSGEAWIVDLKTDTIYTYIKGKINPIAVQSPSVRENNNPKKAINAQDISDRYLFFAIEELYYDPANSKNLVKYKITRSLVWNRKKNKIEKWELYNSDYSSERTARTAGASGGQFTHKNQATLNYPIKALIDAYEKGKLKGKLKKLGAKLYQEKEKYDKESNHVIAIITYK